MPFLDFLQTIGPVARVLVAWWISTTIGLVAIWAATKIGLINEVDIDEWRKISRTTKGTEEQRLSR